MENRSDPEDYIEAVAAAEDEQRAQANLLRCIFGPLPFRPLPPVSAPLLAWNDCLVVHMANAAYEHQGLPSGHLDPARLAVLCDALEEAGCPPDHELLLHLRGPGPHYRGCFAVDAILGRQ
jgi:hypothetical protein